MENPSRSNLGQNFTASRLVRSNHVGHAGMGLPLGGGKLYPARKPRGRTVKVFVLDNYDSFVYTIVGYLKQLGAEVVVHRNNEFPPEAIPEHLAGFDAILISPGPGTPSDAGISRALIRFALKAHIPLLGVCLGHQALAEEFGATVTHAPELMHGKTSEVQHIGGPLFSEVSSPFTATRYHSLAVVASTLPSELIVTAQTESGVVMAIEHRDELLWGVQFHPESVLTQGGYTMFGNWLESAGLKGASKLAASLSPLISEH